MNVNNPGNSSGALVGDGTKAVTEKPAAGSVMLEF